jgi:hypothetical protein
MSLINNNKYINYKFIFKNIRNTVQNTLHKKPPDCGGFLYYIYKKD